MILLLKTLEKLTGLLRVGAFQILQMSQMMIDLGDEGL